MNQSIWEELSRSPLDPDPADEGSGAAWIGPTVLAIVAGLILGIGLGSRTSEPATTTLAAVAETTTTTAPPPDPVVPEGYTEADGRAMRAIATYSQGGNLYMVVDQVVRSDRDPAETDSLYLAKWVLSGDGEQVVAARAYKSIVSPGVMLVEFPGVTQLPNSDPVLEVRKATAMMARTGCNGCGSVSQASTSGEVVLDGLERPYSLTEPLLIPIERGITLSIDQLDVTDDWGYVEWHIIDENDAILRLLPRVSFEGTDDPDIPGEQPTQLVPPHLLGISPQRQSSLNPDPFTRSGALTLDRTGELLLADNQPSALVFDWFAEWQHPVGDPISLPLGDLADLGIIDQ